MTIRVAVVDDQALVRRGFAMVLDHQDDIEVVAEAANGLEAIAITNQHRPDIVLMDIRMPEMDGLTDTASAKRLDSLTDREREVLTELAHGADNAEISETLYIGAATVKSHVSNIFTKLGLRDRAQAVVFAYESGLIAPGSQDIGH